jgi:hypothetical protein
VPGQDLALVLNVGSRDASLLRTTAGETRALRLEVGHDANAIAIAPDGKHAILYFDARRGDTLASSFQDITVVNLVEGAEAARGVSVGFRPRDVRFSVDGARAFIITEDGISVVDLTAAVQGPVIADLISVGDSLGDPISSDVQVTPDGAFAFARREGEARIRRIDLATSAITTLDFSVFQSAAETDGGAASGLLAPEGELELTDLDVAPDGTFLLAVVRNRGALLRIPIPGGFDDPSLVQATFVNEQVVGSISIAPQGSIAAAYTTVGNTEGIVLVNLKEATATRGVRLRKAVRAVAFSEDGTRAFVLHTAASQVGTDEEGRIDASEGYSLLDTTTGFAKLQLTPARIRESDVVVLPDASRLFALLRADGAGVRAVEVADLGSFQVTPLSLAKPPSSIGIVPGIDRIFIGQESEGGMITFVDATTGEVARAVSGFELASRIRQ